MTETVRPRIDRRRFFRDTSQAEVINDEGATNLYFEPIDFEGGFFYKGVSHKIEMLAFQGFIDKEGLVEPHREKEGVTEIYFPLSGVFQADVDGDEQLVAGFLDFSTLESAGFEFEIEGSLILTIRAGDPGGWVKLTPFVIEPGQEHSTSWSAELNGEVEPRFLAMKISPDLA